jgi:hypothetical protein
MSVTGHSVFRNLLLGETAINTATIGQLLFLPASFLKMLVRSENDITPTSLAITQLVGAIFVGLTTPLALGYPNSTAASQVGIRRAAYLTSFAGEVALTPLFLVQYAEGNSGLNDTALLVGAGMCAGLATMRAYFLFVRPDFMAVKDESGKKAK